jgi:hypothetical protein
MREKPMSVRQRSLPILALLNLLTIAKPLPAQSPVEVPPAEAIVDPVPLVPPTTEPMIPVSVVPAGPPAWFVVAEVGVVKPSFTRLGTTPDGEANTFLGLTRSFDLDWTVLPALEIGYRCACGAALQVSYRYLSATGNQQTSVGNAGSVYPSIFAPGPVGTSDAFDPNVPLQRGAHAHLEENWLDLDYVSVTRSDSAAWWRWSLGVRLASLRSDFQTRDDFSLQMSSIAGSPTNPVSIPFTVQQHATDTTFAGGGHVALEGGWQLGETGLALVGKVDGGIMAATNRQSLDVGAIAAVADPVTGAPVTTMPDVTGRVRGPGVIPTVNVQAGLGWSTSWGAACFSLTLGYELERWWFTATGRNAAQNALFTHIDSLSHGPFVRGGLDY